MYRDNSNYIINGSYLKATSDPLGHLFNGTKIWANTSLFWPIICAPLTVRELFSSLSNVWQPETNFKKLILHIMPVIEI